MKQAITLLPVLLLLLAGLPEAKAETPLTDKHRKWLEEDVVYIISEDEKELFLSLPTDAAREKFIKDFWRVRDPSPATPGNEYKEEHYRRIEYANRYFGHGSSGEGWQTDMGRIYIQLGPPQQRAKYQWLGEARPMELWFYWQTEHPSLPNAFNILFYQPQDIGEYRLYSPYLDGPTKLVKRAGTENNRRAAYQYLRTINLELARASLTLLTDEPIDADNFTPSLASDAMLTRIRNLPNDRFTKEKIARQSELRELVETRLFAEPGAMEVLWVPFQHAGGETFVHYVLVLPGSLEELSQADKEGKQHYLSAQLNILVRTPDGRQIFQQNYERVFTFTPREFEAQAQLPVSYADRLPLPPGEYDLDFVWHDTVKQDYYLARQQITVPQGPAELALGPLVAYEKAVRPEPAQPESPFQFFDIRFIPSTRKEFGQGEELAILYQVFLSEAALQGLAGEKLQVEYTLGSVAGRGPRKTFVEEIATKNFDAHGVVLHGKRLPLNELPSGNYRLVVRVTDPEGNRSSARALAFRVVPARPPHKRVTLFNGKYQASLEKGWIDYWRGACQRAHHQWAEAIQSFNASLGKNPKLAPARHGLTDVFFEQERYEEVVALWEAQEFGQEMKWKTVDLLVSSLEKLGRLKQAQEVAEKALATLGPTEEFYLRLAALYDRTGQPEEAEAARREAQRIREKTEEVRKSPQDEVKE